MLSTTIFPGRYFQGPGALRHLGEELSRFAQRALVVCDPVAEDSILPAYPDALEGIDAQVARFGGESSDEEVQRLTAMSQDARIVAGVGGGKTLDTAKAVAHELGLPAACVPTIASTDAPCSALSVIYTPDGQFERYLLLPTNPVLVLVDTEVIAQAPVDFLVAGMGDALATWFEAESCRQSYSSNMTGNVGSMTAYALARLCYDTLLEYGVAAKTACEVEAVTPALERIVEANTLLSGLGFESGGLATAHALHNGLTVLEGAHSESHGGKVSIGVLTSLFLTGKPPQLISEVYDFCEAVGLPTTLADIGLQDATSEDLARVAEAACAEGETIHNEPMPVAPEAVVSALKAADAEGRRRQGC